MKFLKMSGSGNDFVMIDNREGVVSNVATLAKKVCPRGSAVGADGVILLDEDAGSIRMRIINADGTEAEMCGNGARCFAVFAREIGATNGAFSFTTLAGKVGATFTDAGACVELTPPTPIEIYDNLPVDSQALKVYHTDTGVPHAVVFVDDIEKIELDKVGSAIRYHEQFAPKGTNVNFVQKLENNKIAVRTYERGVEGETLACGTGSTASALVTALVEGIDATILVKTRGGDELGIYFNRNGEGFSDVKLDGPAEIIYRGTLE